MKTILIAILAGLSVALAGVLGWQRLNQSAGNQMAANQLSTNQLAVNQLGANQLPANQLPENKQCLAEGEKDYIYEYKASINEYGYMCCPGLTPTIGNDYLGADGVCYAGEGDLRILCTKCGDGVCGLAENECNCPQDCGEPAFIKNNFRKIVNKNVGQWQTYKNEQYGFEIKYPPGALLTEGRTHERPDSGVISISGYTLTPDDSPKSDSWHFDIDVIEVSPGTSLEQWWKNTFKCDPKEYCFDASFTKYEQSEIGGYPAFKSVLPSGGEGELNVSRIGYYVLKDNHIYIIVANPYYMQAILKIDQMLSTFKFTK